MNDAGDILVAWDDGNQLWAIAFDPTTGWGTPAKVRDVTGLGTGLANSRVATGTKGTGVAMWIESSEASRDIWTSTFDRIGGWSAPAILQSNGQSSAGLGETLAVGTDATGNAIAVWSQDGGIWTSRYTSGTGWSSPAFLGSGSAPKLSVNPAGNTLSVWWDADVIASYFDPSTGWGVPVPLNVPTSTTFWDVSLAPDGTGYAYHSIDSNTPGEWRIGLNHFIPASGWGSEQAFTPSNDPTSVSFGGAATATVIWSSFILGSEGFVFTDTFDPLAGWGSEDTIGGEHRSPCPPASFE